MDRHTVFRGKRIDNGEWIRGDLIHNIIGHKCFIRRCELFPTIAVENNTIGQRVTFCGKDYESEVYEGDIVSFPTFNKKYNFGLITYENYEWILKNKNGKKLMSLSVIEYEDWEQAKIVGNIYDNPELIKEEKK